MYRTGDLARSRLEDGCCTLEFLGRVDDQVKIRGFRVEPGEIEVLLKRHDDIREAVVMVREDTAGRQRLISYVRAKDVGEWSPSATELRAFLANTLPDYMLPSAFVFLETFPLTPNGKVDRRALPIPEETSDEACYEAPVTPTEEQLAAIWAELLELERVSALAHFFDLGGHSLLATRLISRIRKRLGVEIALVDLFHEPTLRELANHIDNRLWATYHQDAVTAGIDEDQEEIVL